MARAYCPQRGDIVWIRFSPQAGHEQAGLRPALTLSPEAYNRKVGLGLFCPVTTQVKGYPFEVALPAGLKAAGVILADQVKSFDWESWGAKFCCRISKETLAEVLEKLGVLIFP